MEVIRTQLVVDFLVKLPQNLIFMREIAFILFNQRKTNQISGNPIATVNRNLLLNPGALAASTRTGHNK
jgi:hypothetical protein